MKFQIDSTSRIIALNTDEFPCPDGWIEVEEYPHEMIGDSFHWFYINSEFVREPEEDIRKREEEERRRAERNAPVLLQTQYITREEFNLLPYQDTNTLYYILEDDGTATMQKGVN